MPTIVQQRTNGHYWLTIPVSIVHALDIKKGETVNWKLDKKNTLYLQRGKR